MKGFGRSLSAESRQCRAKRIAVNVKVNGLAYVVELMGGVGCVGMALIPKDIFLHIAYLIWYANVIPSCYLINTSDNKDSIIDKGWAFVISKLFENKRERDRKNLYEQARLEKKQKAEKAQAENSALTSDESIASDRSTMPHGGQVNANNCCCAPKIGVSNAVNNLSGTGRINHEVSGDSLFTEF